jgi:hypothetical protein
MSKIKRPPLTLPQYERIFRSVHGLLLNEECDPSKSCTYFSVIGAFLIQQHHRMNASPRAGVAAYNLALPDNKVIVFGKLDDGMLVSTELAFHFWVEIDDWIIDFSAPLLQGASIKPKMIQKACRNFSHDPASLNEPGAYAHIVNSQLTNELLIDFQAHPLNMDLVKICTQWYRPPPKDMAPSVTIANAQGETSEVRLSPVRLVGAW